MIVKAVEIRDKATFIPAIAIKMAPATDGQRYLLRRVGYGFDPPVKRALGIELERAA